MDKKDSNRGAQAVVAALIVIIVGLCFLLWQDYGRIRASQTRSAERIQFSQLLRHKTLTAADVSSIQPWMTFDYVSFAFKVPAAALKESLSLVSPQYPYISIVRYSKTAKLDEVAFTAQVESAVRAYLVGIATSTNP